MTLFERLFPGNLVVWYTESMKTCFCMTYRRERNGRNGRTGISAFAAAMLRFCSCLIAALILASAAAGEKSTWEDRLAQARIRYNEETVNIYQRWERKYTPGKINVVIFNKKWPYVDIKIMESLQITDEAEMEAILEVITKSRYYDEDKYGSIPFMKAEWIAHNLAHSMATGSEEQKRLIETLVGESLSDITGAAEELDLSQFGYMEKGQRAAYELIEFICGLNRN